MYKSLYNASKQGLLNGKMGFCLYGVTLGISICIPVAFNLQEEDAVCITNVW